MSNIHSAPMYVYSKQVKDNDVKSDTLIRKIDKKQVSDIISTLKEIGKLRKFEDFELQENCKEWVCDILSGYSNNKETTLKYLLNDFTDSMMTRMREKDKFALAIVFEDTLFLCHSSIGERTITPIWKVADRMLDRDNVERFVIFKKEGGISTVTYYEHFPSEFFTRWLGIPDREAFFYLGGKNRLYINIDGVHCVLELTDDDVENKLLNNVSQFKVDKNQLILKSPIERLEINQIRVGKKRYKTIGNFFQDYLARRYELSYYQQEYKKLSESLEVLTVAYFDDIDKVVAVSSDGDWTKLKKRNPNFHILFAGKLISGAIVEMRESFFDKIFADFMNGVPIRTFHAGMKMYLQSEGPFKIGSLEIFNKIESNIIVTRLSNFCQETKILDSTLKIALNYTIFFLLSKTNETKPISYFLTKFANELRKNIHSSNIIIQNENNVIEFKSRDYMVGRDNEVSKRISVDIKSKIKSSPFKIYFFGVEDKTKKLDPLPSNRFSSDRISSLEYQISLELTKEVSVNLLKIPFDTSDECLLAMLVSKGVEN